jgi:hypothetical protein
MIGVPMAPTLLVYPPNDSAFVGNAHLLVDNGVISATELQRRLRLEYPRAVVHVRMLSGEPNVIWYVYRDGRWNP